MQETRKERLRPCWALNSQQGREAHGPGLERAEPGEAACRPGEGAAASPHSGEKPQEF